MSLKKRSRTENESDAASSSSTIMENNDNDDDDGDPCIGLDIGGKRFYCYQSTLTNNSQYFAAKFSGNWGAGCSYKDEIGRQIYFIDRNGAPFEYILSYLRTPVGLPVELPNFHENPRLWRLLRLEADYFGLSDLADLLQVTYSCSPDSHGGQGILYWLGTNKGREQEYQNPFKRGVIHVGGWVDMSKEELTAIGETESLAGCAGTPGSRAQLVQYRPEVYGIRNPETEEEEFVLQTVREDTYLLFCCDSGERKPVVVDLKSIRLKPTHVSIRHHLICSCYGMSRADWDFEASVDGRAWDALLKNRKAENEPLREKFSRESVSEYLSSVVGKNKKDIVTAWAERNHRETWQLEPQPTAYYRYFRFIGAGSRDGGGNGDDELDVGCMHGLGLELYGDVHEP